MSSPDQEIQKRHGTGNETKEFDKEKWVHDSTRDHKGGLPLRASTGVWKAALFIVAIEFSERLTYFGLGTVLISYLTKVMHQDLKTSAKNVNYWIGVTTIMPLFGAFLADAYTGRFLMILISSIIYLAGLSLLTMSQYVPSLRPCASTMCTHPRKVHEVVFFLGMYLISFGTGGHKPCLESFGADQFDDDHTEERKQKMSYFNWWNFSLCCGLLLAVTVMAHVQESVSYGAADIILTFTMAFAILLFCLGKPYYRYRMPDRSPLTPLLHVLVAAFAKRKIPYPSSPALLYEVPKSQNSKGRLLCHTNNFRFLDKAAIIEGNDSILGNEEQSSWRLATVTRVEEMKLVLNMIPIWLTSLPFGLTVVQSSTFFLKQSSTMDRKLVSFVIPPASLYALSAFATVISVLAYEKILAPIMRKATGSERGISILQRIGIGMVLSVVAMAIAALVERKRLNIAHQEIGHLGNTRTVSMSVFWLAPQFMILGVGDAFTLVGLQEYFYEQVPDSMRSLGIASYLSVMGVGSFLSSSLISIVDHVTRKTGTSWFGKDQNKSRVDNFYWLLAALNGLNLCIYVPLAKRYAYKNVRREIVAHGNVGDKTESMA